MHVNPRAEDLADFARFQVLAQLLQRVNSQLFVDTENAFWIEGGPSCQFRHLRGHATQLFVEALKPTRLDDLGNNAGNRGPNTR